VGERIAEIGPLPISEGETYSAQYMEAIFTPGVTSRAHIHSGPEAWYTLTGETCLETPQGKQVGRAGGQYVIVPGGPQMHLTATGSETRRAIVLVLHDSSKPASTPVYDWTPKGAKTDFLQLGRLSQEHHKQSRQLGPNGDAPRLIESSHVQEAPRRVRVSSLVWEPLLAL